jgi:NTP pyrophosphatase (non-canonical NTP hydrolase)
MNPTNLIPHKGIPRSCDEHWGDFEPEEKVCPFCYKTLYSDHNSYTCHTCKKTWPHDYLSIAQPIDFNFLKNAKRLSDKATYGRNESFTHLVEEVGEVGTCLNNEKTKRKTLKEPLQNECIDVINCAMELFFKQGGTIDEFYRIIETKQKKWENNLDKIK